MRLIIKDKLNQITNPIVNVSINEIVIRIGTGLIIFRIREKSDKFLLLALFCLVNL